MNLEKSLLKRLEEYGRSGLYPFHMPGHKRRTDLKPMIKFPNPYDVDITEIEGFDNLHHPEGILKESMDWAASVYGTDRTYYLTGGSSCGVMSAVCAAVPVGCEILMARNCHRSAYNAVHLNQLKPTYLWPEMIPEYGIQGGVRAEDVEKALKENPDIRAVLVVSPTYDGIVSDIQALADAAHAAGKPLIVDEAHGAHFCFGRDYPRSAVELGADVVIQSLHKTLPSLTQTAVLHWRKGYVDRNRIERYLRIYQSSSPSYVFLASIEGCIETMELHGEESASYHMARLKRLRGSFKGLKRLRILGEEVIGAHGVNEVDLSKIVVSCRDTPWNGADLEGILRDRYGLEMEMCGADYVTAITSICDSEEGLERLRKALLEIDEEADNPVDTSADRRNILWEKEGNSVTLYDSRFAPVRRMDPHEAMDADVNVISLPDAAGRITSEYLWLYPPGIPAVVPGEVLSREILYRTLRYKKAGLPVQGLADKGLKTIRVVAEEGG